MCIFVIAKDWENMKKLAMSLLLAALCAPMVAQTRQERLTQHVYYFASDSLKGRAAGFEDTAKAAAWQRLSSASAIHSGGLPGEV
jgi:cell division protein FtsW (lipid II flippase)